MVAFDASGNGNNGTLVNSPTVTRGGLWGYKGLTFNGTSQSVTVPNISNVRSFTAILVPTANNKTVFNLGGSNVISLNSSNQIATTGLTGVTIYVNGSSVNLLNLNAPNVVTVNFDAVTLSSASLANSSFSGKMANVTLRTETTDFGKHRSVFEAFFTP